ncbi:cytidine deaminase [Phocicoccus pinnipedialis]|uniref:Cytidine deaminase n=1 Tax=Phocicoccus pinnipedialis TaxID=110845 RepID=A0A6V7RE48_9BACL|nr:cytidine deaminase [Jeotgalicoccus pinnipedialis]MBP1939271.1 cytidine deaminase [Jeotgalicoccus pinnipedialis]CAD2076078.1 Cytidine deaminase [Jeotgalicoccus pinnipedialis]
MNDGIFKEEWLVEVQEAQKRAYTPYSNFNVGALLITEDDEYIYGANIENASYPATICAERTALVSAYANGKTKFKAIVVITDAPDPASPCGVCRQVLKELTSDDMPVYMASKDGRVIKRTVDELLPLGFSGKDME